MTGPKLLQPIGNLLERFRPAFFSRQEWVFHVCLAMASIPVGNRLFFGPRYFTGPSVFVIGTVCGLILYIISITVLVSVARRVIAAYPGSRQTLQRTVTMILLILAFTLPYNVIELLIVSRIPIFGITFGWAIIWPVWLVDVIFICLFSIVLNLFYAYKQWKREQAEVESLKIQTVQQQLDLLKQQVNPHFLFNSLSSISSLVSEDPDEAERFVDGLAKVYRYMLQANSRAQVTLSDELSFIRTYANLLNVRYGQSLRISVPPPCTDLPCTLPTLSLQVLIDNALKHNRMSPSQPLIIDLSVVEGPGIRVINTLQRKTRLLDIDRHGLSHLITRYRSLTDSPIAIQQADDTFSVTLPLLTAATQLTEPRRL